MEVIDKYLTLSGLSEGIYKEKGSKFIAYAVPCYSPEEAKEHLIQWRKQHHTARHVCYAYRFGLKKDIYRANDDGEPSNSAGVPILGQIQSADLTNVLIGVVRYFGGTKLGVGGLVSAYKTAAKEAIQNGEIIEKQVFWHYKLAFEYTIMPEIMSVLKSLNAVIEQQQFELNCSIQVALEAARTDSFFHKTELLAIEITDLGIY